MFVAERIAHTFHGNGRHLKPKLCKELYRPFPSRAKHPCDARIVARNVLDQCTANPLQPVLLRYDHHGKVAIGDAIGNRPGEPNNLVIRDSDGCSLRTGQELRKCFRAPCSMGPSVGAKELPHRFDFLYLCVTNEHGFFEPNICGSCRCLATSASACAAGHREGNCPFDDGAKKENQKIPPFPLHYLRTPGACRNPPVLLLNRRPNHGTCEMEGSEMKMPFSNCEAYVGVKQAQRIEIARSPAGARP